MTISIYETRKMLAPLVVDTSPRTFLLKMFFPAMEEFATLTVDLDYVKKNRRKAAYVKRRSQGQVVDAPGFSTKTVTPPYLKPFIPTDADEVYRRAMGQPIYGGVNPLQKAAIKLTKDLMELDEMVTRTEEFQGSQALVSDSVEIHDEDGNEVVADIDYGRDPTHTFTNVAADRWNNAASKPLLQLKNWKVQLIGKNGGVAADMVVMGSDAADAFLDNANVQAKLDNRQMFAGVEISVIQKEFGVIYLGTYFGMDIYQYDEWYWDGTTNVEIMPAKKIIMGSTAGRGIRLYGAIRHNTAGEQGLRRFPWTYENDAGDMRFAQVHSAPQIFPANPDANLCATVLV